MTLLAPDHSGNPFQLQFNAGLPGPFESPCIFLLDDGALHAGAISRSSDLFPAGSLITTNPVDGGHEPFEITLNRVIGWVHAGPRDRRGLFGRPAAVPGGSN